MDVVPSWGCHSKELCPEDATPLSMRACVGLLLLSVRCDFVLRRRHGYGAVPALSPPARADPRCSSHFGTEQLRTVGGSLIIFRSLKKYCGGSRSRKVVNKSPYKP